MEASQSNVIERLKGLKMKAVYLLLIIILFGTLTLALVASIQYSLTYKVVEFSPQESNELLQESMSIGPTMIATELINDVPISHPPSMTFLNPEPVRNTTWFDNGSKFESITLFERIVISDGGSAIRENQVAAEEMKQSSQIFDWSYTILDAYEDVTKGEKKLNNILEWISFKSGITHLLTNLKRCI